MIVDLKRYRWNGHTWAGWWSNDPTKPIEHHKIRLRQLDSRDMYAGKAFDFDVPNGFDWSPEEIGLDRWTMEGAQVDFYSGVFTLTGFVQMTRYGKNAGDAVEKTDSAGSNPELYSKERWVITKVKQ